MAITHELKTPIAIAKLNLETLQKRKLDESQQQRLIQNTIQEANRLNALCNNMLLVSQMEDKRYHLTKENFDLSALVTDCVNDFKNRFPERVYHTAINNDIFITGDRLLLQMAVNNLIDNAGKYSAKDAVVTISLQQQESKINLSVKDEGRGIAAEDRKKVFEKFFRVPKGDVHDVKGFGLGLAYIKKIIELHEGTIELESEKNNGTTFTITLPYA